MEKHLDTKPRLYNRLEDNFHLSNKKALFHNMKRFYTQKNLDPFDYLPLTFHVKKGLCCPEFANFKHYYD